MSPPPLAPRTNGRTPPSVPGGLPLLGHAGAFRRNPVRFLRQCRERHGDVFRFRLAGRPILFLTGPKGNAAFFRAPDDLLSPREAYQFTVPIFGRGIAYDVSPQRMDEQLELVFPALHERRLQRYVGFMAEEAEAYVDRWRDEGVVDLLEAANELTIFIATRCLIGDEVRSNLSAEFARLYHDLEGGINLAAFFFPHLPLPAFRRRDRARERVVALISRLIAERRARGTEGEDFLQTLMTARYADGSALTDDQIAGLLLTLIFAGQHTSAVLAAWTGILLLQHPPTLGAVLREQEVVFGGPAAMTLEGIRRLAVLERAVREAERLHPPLVLLMRKVLRDFVYDGYVVPPGWFAMVSPAVSHRIPEVFPDPDRYDPDRFAPGREEDRKAAFSLIGFGGGKHRCLGLAFADLQIKALWSVLLRRFDLELIDRAPEPDYATFVVGPRRPCRLRYRRRRAAAIAVTAALGSAGPGPAP